MSNFRFYLIMGVLRLLSALPFRLLYMVSDGVYYLIRYVLRYRYHLVKENLERSFPEKDDGWIRAVANAFYLHLADCIFETIKLLHISDRQLEQHIEVRGTDVVEKLAIDGNPIVVFLGHYGNWEWVQEVTRHYRRPAVNAEIYRPVKDKVMDRVMLSIRARFATTPIPQKQAIRHLLGMKRDGTQFLVGFVADQRPNSKNLHHWTTFLNQDTAFATGGEELGKHINAHYVYLDIEKPRRGHYVFTFKEMVVDGNGQEPYPYTRLFLRLIEQTIRRAPEYWLWSHNRWKYDREGNKIHVE